MPYSFKKGKLTKDKNGSICKATKRFNSIRLRADTLAYNVSNKMSCSKYDVYSEPVFFHYHYEYMLPSGKVIGKEKYTMVMSLLKKLKLTQYEGISLEELEKAEPVITTIESTATSNYVMKEYYYGIVAQYKNIRETAKAIGYMEILHA